MRKRFSNRKTQSHAYAPLSPVLHYNPGQGDLVGGNFWDKMRATGRRLGNPAAEQAEGPPTNPLDALVGVVIIGPNFELLHTRSVLARCERLQSRGRCCPAASSILMR